MYAIVRDGSNQFRAEKGAVVRLAYREAAKPGDAVTLDQVLLVGEGDQVSVGQPVVSGATVTTRVKGTAKGEKLIIYRYRRRKNSDKKRGHRQKYTEAVVESVSTGS